ncbi:ABC transporter substrate-binding protein [Nocardia sp. NPDC052566]|uniref:ABC transporter substrate-binding protein n=1 Tax=Nocardia sp. NPDC052566 TaxID=3364330 RepID=UPI0037C58F15
MWTTLTVGVFTPSVLLAVAADAGTLAARELTVEQVRVGSSPGQFRALLDGDLDIALTSPDNVLAYRYDPANPLGELADVRIVAGLDRSMGLALYGRPGLTDPAQLRGATLGVDVPTSGFALAMYALTESLGIDRDTYELATLGSTPRRLEALLAGRCDATMLGAGNELHAEQAGCVRFASVAEVCAPYLGSVLAVAGDKALAPAHRLADALHATAAAILAGHLDHQVRDAATTLLDLSGDLATRYLDRLRHPTEGLIDHTEFDPAALATVIDLRRRYLPTPALARALDPDPATGLLALART